MDSVVPLQQFTSLLQLISEQPAQKKKLYLLTKFWAKYGDKLRGDRAKPDYMILRLMLPELDYDRRTFNMKEAAIAKLYIDIYNLDKTMTPDAAALLNWKDPGRGSANLGGSFTAVLLSVMEQRSRRDSILSVAQLNEKLDTLHRTTKTEKKEGALWSSLTLTPIDVN